MNELIISPHIDDEVIGLGEFLLHLSQKNPTNPQKSKIHIVYLSSSTYSFEKTDSEFESKDQMRRESEAKVLAKKLNIPLRNITFLRENNYSSFNKETFLKVSKKIESLIKKIKPLSVYVPAYEGGHLEHDLMNFLVSILRKKALLEEVYEFPEYTSYISFLDWKKLLRRFGFQYNHSFLDKRAVQRSPQERLTDKKKLLKIFKSQKPQELIKLFGYRDQYGRLKHYNYRKAPYSFGWQTILGLFFPSFKIYGGSISSKEFRLFVDSVEHELLKDNSKLCYPKTIS
jgi:LmbE family N-acetylglucosaminyl deacetylase